MYKEPGRLCHIIEHAVVNVDRTGPVTLQERPSQGEAPLVCALADAGASAPRVCLRSQRPHKFLPPSPSLGSQHAKEPATLIVRVVVKVAKIDEYAKRHDQGFVVRVLHAPKIDMVVVHIGSEEELAAARNLLLHLPHSFAALGVLDRKGHLGARATRQRAAQAPLAATAVRLQGRIAVLTLDREGEVAAREGVDDRANLPPLGYVSDVHHGPVEAAASAGPVAAQLVDGLGAPVLRVDDVDVPRRTVWQALLELTLAAARLLHRVEHLLAGAFVEDLVLVSHLYLLPESRGDRLDQAGLLLDVDPLHAGQALNVRRAVRHGKLRGVGCASVAVRWPLLQAAGQISSLSQSGLGQSG